MTEAAEEKPEIVGRELKIKLTDAETLEKARAAAQLNQEINELEEELEKHKTRIKKAREPKEIALKTHLEVIQAGVESKMVEVELRRNYGLGIVEYIYEGNVVESRNMDSEDRQLNLVTPESTVGYKSEEDEIRDVMREETNAKTKHDHLTTDVEQIPEDASDEDLDPMSAKVHTLTNLTEATE